MGTNEAFGSPAAEDLTWALRMGAGYNVPANVVYGRSDAFELKLDVYRPWTSAAPRPTLMFMHGGGWMDGASKETWALWFLPFLQLGWIVVNVGYRPSSVASAPAAVEDCLHALSWIARNVHQFDIDIDQFVIGGLSAGGHLALTTGMIPSSPPIRPAAIVNWCGVTDITDLAYGPNRQDYVAQWLGMGPDRPAVARQVSPLTYVRAGLPPIISVHGDADQLVPYSHAVRLHAARPGASALQLFTIDTLSRPPRQHITSPRPPQSRLGFLATRDG